MGGTVTPSPSRRNGLRHECSPLAFELPDELLDAIAERVAERLNVSEREDTSYLDVAAAAEFLACPFSRIYALVSSDRIPHHRDGSRLLFDREELAST